MRVFAAVIVALLLQGMPELRAETTAPFRVAPYFDNTTVDLTRVLPPPPASDSPETKSELGELLVIQVSRTPELVSRAQADAIEEIRRFADVVGPKFTPENLPKTAAFFARLVATDNAVVDLGQGQLRPVRPHLVSDLIKPVVKLSTSGSWPSSHASLGTLMGIVLGDMIPEKRGVIMERAWTYAENRLVAGMHFPSDIEMGRISGSVIAAFAMKQPQFVSDYQASRTELRTLLGL